MTRRITNLAVTASLALVLGFFGCNGSSAPDSAADKGHTEHDGHDHGEKGEAHAHPSEGPHHGHLIELGKEEFHAELTHDDATKTITVYLLDHEAKAPVTSTDAEIVLNLVVDGKPLQAKLAAAPQESDPAGSASRFSITDEKVLEALEAPKTTGRLNVTIADKAYTGSVEHHDHDHDEHKH